MTDFRPSRFEILPMVVKNLIIINVLCYIAQLTLIGNGKEELINQLALHSWRSPDFKPWQFVSYMFLHSTEEFRWIHLIANMVGLWMFGSVLENIWGPKRFLLFYLVCGLSAALATELANHVQVNMILAAFHKIDPASAAVQQQIDAFTGKYLAPADLRTPLPPGYKFTYIEATQILNWAVAEKVALASIGASGGVFGCMVAFAYLYPDSKFMIFPIPIPIKAKWLVLGYIAYELIFAIANRKFDTVGHIAHLGGALLGFVLVYYWNRNNRRTFY